GCLQDAAIWNVALSDREMQALNSGFSPLLIRPKALVLYVPLLSFDSRTVNLVGPPVIAQNIEACIDSPRIITPEGFRIGQGVLPPPPHIPRHLYFIERMDNRLWPSIEDAWCLDSALALPQTEPNATMEATSATGDRAIRTYNIINGGSGYTAPIGQI